jgi:hypothetical protein
LAIIFGRFDDSFQAGLGSNESVLEIKTCGLGSRICDIEAEWSLRVITDKTYY